MIASIVPGMKDIRVQEITGLVVRIRHAWLLFCVVRKEILCVNSVLFCTWKTAMFYVMFKLE